MFVSRFKCGLFYSILGFFAFQTYVGYGQETNSPIVNYLLKSGYVFPTSETELKTRDCLSQWPDTLYYNTKYKSRLMGSATVPISFSSLEFTSGNYIVSPTIGLGVGYTWFLGDFIFNDDDKMTIDPTFFFGVIGIAGLENNFSFNKLASFATGGFVGFGAFTLFGGYDIINKTPSVGLGGRIDFFTISQKYLRVFGKVHEVRRHKRFAQAITPE